MSQNSCGAAPPRVEMYFMSGWDRGKAFAHKEFIDITKCRYDKFCLIDDEIESFYPKIGFFRVMMRKLVAENRRRAEVVRRLDGAQLFHQQALVTVRLVADVFLFDIGDAPENLILNHGNALRVAEDQGINRFLLV